MPAAGAPPGAHTIPVPPFLQDWNQEGTHQAGRSEAAVTGQLRILEHSNHCSAYSDCQLMQL